MELTDVNLYFWISFVSLCGLSIMFIVYIWYPIYNQCCKIASYVFSTILFLLFIIFLYLAVFVSNNPNSIIDEMKGKLINTSVKSLFNN